jgi:hypothetical protein
MSIEGKAVMGAVSTSSIAAIVFVYAVVLAAPSPAAAVTADLAKRCREMAVKAHPPKAPGSKPYAQAEREYFRECVANKGNMPEDSSQSPSAMPTGAPDD